MIKERCGSQRYTVNHKHVTTAQAKTPVEITTGGVTIHQNNIATIHEKADNVIVQQAVRVAVEEPRSVTVTVLADDTDVYFEQCLETPML